ncbi:DNA-processing protein DprA [Thiothrix nivea]|uniref:DNA protecting protein DprA n=1 Tax=Thiothrix nivea (strain ATCC 35100 / DSM 5205 / JP2) TaxID=870187 RepID=A0A656HFT9_THINJ|nr:DNA-processing protein DprA [Thiothrix nivea]EIJ35062.1 DNA protecting protein DprA [Thiothrix nivea DSM 5205]
MTINLSDEELRARLHFWRAKGIGPGSMRRIVEHFGGAAAALAVSDNALLEAGLKREGIAAYRETPANAAEPDWRWLEAADQHYILVPEDSRYPNLLKRIRTAPPLLFALGNPELLNDPQIAMVGSRNPTQGGKENARAFAAHFAANGLTVTSGLAVGIDAHSHEAALEAGGQTIAVVGNGLDIIYPLRNRKLAERIAAQGCIVSEFPIGIQAHPQHFPRRNRIISGMSFGVLIVEAALQSGTLVTARHAMEQGREVFAIPGSIHNPLARGCHHLIRQGAKLVETANDVLEEIAPQLNVWLQQDKAATSTQGQLALTGVNDVQPIDTFDPEYAQVLDALGYEPLPIDRIILNTGLTAEEVSSILLMLELHGLVAACGGGHYMRLGSGNGN